MYKPCFCVVSAVLCRVRSYVRPIFTLPNAFVVAAVTHTHRGVVLLAESQLVAVLVYTITNAGIKKYKTDDERRRRCTRVSTQ